eukprot:6490595-Amphidinium_carterae.1
MWITHQTSQTGTTVGMESTTITTRSMGYFKTMLSVQNTLQATYFNKKHNFRRLTKVRRYLHNRRLKSTMLRIYLTETGANTVYKAKANHNIIRKVDSQNKALLRSTTRSSRATTTITILQCLRCVNRLQDWAMYATVVPNTGINPEAVKAISRSILENGLQNTILHSDGEPAIIALQTEITRQQFLILRCKHHLHTAINHKAW